MQELIKLIIYLWNQFLQYLSTGINLAIYIYQEYKFITWILIIIAIIILISKIIWLIEQTLNIYKSFFLSIFHFLKIIFLIIWNILKVIFYFFYYIFTTGKREKWRKEMTNSIYNVIPHSYEIPWYYNIRRKVKKQALNRLYCIESCIRTQENIKNQCGYITMLEGFIGGGKTTFCNAYSHIRIPIYQEMITTDLYSIEKKLFELDYSYIRNFIEIRYSIGEAEQKIYEELLATLDKHNLSGVFNDYVSDIPKESLIKKYVIGYCAKLRNNYTMCNYHLFNRLTKTYNYDLDPNLFNIKDENAIKKFFIPSYITIIDDEKALSEFKNTETPKELDKLGTDIAMRLLRQLREETIFYISSTQNTSRIALLLRELANTYISIQSFSIVGDQNALANIYRKKQKKYEKKMNRHAKIFYRNKEKREKYLLSNNKYKQSINYWFLKEKEVFASAFVKYKIQVSNRLSDLNSEKATSYEWTFPLTWTFGVYRKCEYADFYEFLNQMSDVKSEHQLKVISSLYESSEDKYQSMIKQKEKKTKKDNKER